MPVSTFPTIPWPALVGGVMIGVAASLLLWCNGRIAGVSGILGRLLPPRHGDSLWRVLFLAGLVAGAALAYGGLVDAPLARAHFPPSLLVIAGILVGYGSALGQGCTSGHGVCGLGRRSLRSLSATLIFLLVGMVSTCATRHIAGVF